jgi:hypothetical protein
MDSTFTKRLSKLQRYSTWRECIPMARNTSDFALSSCRPTAASAARRGGTDTPIACKCCERWRDVVETTGMSRGVVLPLILSRFSQNAREFVRRGRRRILCSRRQQPAHTHVTKERRRGRSLSMEGSIVMSRVAHGRNATHFAGSGIERGVCR